MLTTPQKIILRYRDTAILFTIIFAMTCLSSMPYRYSPVEYSLITLITGLIVGFLYMRKSTKKQLRIIEKDGYYKPKQKTQILPSTRRFFGILLLVLIGFSIIIAWFIYVLEVAPFWLFTFNFIIGFAPAVSITRTAYYWHWQHKNKRTLLMSDNILYPYPYMNQPTSKETVY